MQSKIKDYFSIVQDYYDDQSKYFDSRIEVHRQTKKLIELSKQIISFEEEKELKKIELENFRIRQNLTEKEKLSFKKIEDQIKDLKEKISRKKLEVDKSASEREKINATSIYLKKQMDEKLGEINSSKPNPSLRHPVNYLLLK